MQNRIYTPLPPERPSQKPVAYSRIAELWPGEGADPLYCTLRIIDIENAPFPFEALSYVWGREKSDNPLLCGDDHSRVHGQLQITKNLEHALRSLRLPNLVRRLWIDAIVIRQDDVAERSRQVRYMRLVYQHAARVIVYLGQKNASVRKAFTFAQELSVFLPSTYANAAYIGTAEEIQHARDSIYEATWSVCEAFKSRPEDARAVESLLTVEYFERVWCVQEIASAKSFIAKCEDLEIDLIYLLFLVPAIKESRGLTFNPSGLHMWQGVLEQKFGMRNMLGPVGSLGPLLVILMGIRNFKSTDPRDRIFALMGCTDEGIDPLLPIRKPQFAPGSESILRRGLIRLLEKRKSFAPPGIDRGQHPSLHPNYEKSVLDVYRDFTRFFIRRVPRVLDILSHVQHHSDPGFDEFPSWVPKFYEPTITSFFILQICSAGLAPGKRARVHDNPLMPGMLWNSVAEPNILQPDGFRVDTVEAISDTILENFHHGNAMEEVWQQLFPFPLFPRPGVRYYHQDESLDVAFFMTLLADAAIHRLHDLRTDNTVLLPTLRVQGTGQADYFAKADIYTYLQRKLHVRMDTYTDLVPDPRDDREQSPVNFERASLMYSIHRRVYRTKTGILGLGPRIMKPGDHVVVLFGGRYPFVLRPIGAQWQLIGDTYLRHDGIMYGNMTSKVWDGSAQSRIETFRIC